MPVMTAARSPDGKLELFVMSWLAGKFRLFGEIIADVDQPVAATVALVRQSQALGRPPDEQVWPLRPRWPRRVLAGRSYSVRRARRTRRGDPAVGNDDGRGRRRV